jgi:hypothetical protein
MSGGHQKAPSFSDQWSPVHIQYMVNIKTKPQVIDQTLFITFFQKAPPMAIGQKSPSNSNLKLV